MKLIDLVPSHEIMLAMAPEELAGFALILLVEKHGSDGGKVHPSSLHAPENLSGFPRGYLYECRNALMESWMVLVREGLVAPVPDDHHGWYFITRRGQSAKSLEALAALRSAALFPKDSIHERVRPVFAAFIRGEYESAIFQALKSLEMRVRDLCPQEMSQMYGVPLMRKAFDAAKGPLSDQSEPDAEREALAALFSGVIGRFKNPASHRHFPITDPTETVEILQFASSLHRVLDDVQKRIEAMP